MSREQSFERMQGWIVGDDHQLTCLVALVSAAGAEDRHAAVAHVFETAEQVENLSASVLHVAGPTTEGVAIDHVSTANLLELDCVSYLVCFSIMLICLRSFRATLLVFLIALFNEQLSLAIIHYCGSSMDSVLLLTANLNFVLSISIGIHLVNYYRDAQSTHSAEDAPIQACFVAMKPTVLATTTTALGLISLAISEVLPLKRFGVYSAVGVMLAAAISTIYIGLHFRNLAACSSTTNEFQV